MQLQFSRTALPVKGHYEVLSETDSPNYLVWGDNLPVLKDMQDEGVFVKMAYIDPPYNTGVNFPQYTDKFDHEEWADQFTARLEIIHSLLTEDGSVWISLDDNEQAYAKVIGDQIFGRNNFVANIIWEKKYTASNDAKWFSNVHDYLIVFAKDKKLFKPNRVPRTPEMDERYTNPDNDPRGPWKSTPLHAKSGTNTEPYTFKNGIVWTPPAGTYRRFTDESMKQLEEEGRISFPKKEGGTPRKKTYLSELKEGVPARTIWYYKDVGHNDEAKREAKEIEAPSVFATPKPKRLLERIISIATEPEDMILDPYLGSGTTAVVASTLNRKWIGIEAGDHCFTHCAQRLDQDNIRYKFYKFVKDDN